MTLPISILDLSPVPSGATAMTAVQNTIDLAKHAEAIGLTRFWLAEHHNAGSLASSSPEILIGAVAAATARIRVGSGGIMLPNHAPLKVAETFRVLGALHPRRIDLGVGRAAGTDPKTALALRQAKELLGAESFPEQLEELMTFVSRDPDPNARFGPIKAVPIGVPAPPVFVLGSGLDSARLAARLGVGYAFAHHIGPDGYADAMRLYRTHFQKSSHPCGLAAPYAILATGVICLADESDLDAYERASSIGWLRFGQGLRDLPMPSLDEARAYRFDPEEDVLREQGRGRSLIGETSRIADKLREMVEASGADELMAMTGVHDHDERKRSYDRLLRAFS